MDADTVINPPFPDVEIVVQRSYLIQEGLEAIRWLSQDLKL